MQEAISMYLGGEIIDASVCNYNSYKELGLKCPYCQAAVFLRSNTEYVYNDKTVKRSSCFSHFKRDENQGLVCEARAQTKEGKEHIQRINLKNQNQRFELYNKYFAEILTCEQKNLKSFKTIKKAVEAIAELSNVYLPRHIGLIHKQFVENCMGIKENKNKALASKEKLSLKLERDGSKLCETSLSFARDPVNDLIFYEIVCYAASNMTSKLFQEIFYLSAQQLASEVVKYFTGMDTRKKLFFDKFYGGKDTNETLTLVIKKELLSDALYAAEGLLILMCTADYVDFIDKIKRNCNNRKGF
ncbi:MAG: hypothetical protein ACRC4X_05410 [Cetobacterium sp.]